MKKNNSLYYFTLILVTFVCFLPCLKASFVYWDDPLFLLDNISVRLMNAQGIKKIFTQVISGVYVPLSILSYAVEYHFFRMNPFVYHLDNLLLHIANTVLVFLLALRFGLTRRAAWMGALLFGIHPMHVESVAWVTARKEVLYAFFYLLSVHAYCRYFSAGKYKFYALSIIAGLLSVLAKPMALSLPLILLLCDWFHKRAARITRLIIEKAPYALFIVPFVWLTYRLHVRVPWSKGMLESFLTWIWCLTFYLKKFIWPFPCLPLYNMPDNFYDAQFGQAMVIFIGAVSLLIFFRKNRLLCFACWFYFLSVFFLLRFDTRQDLQVVSDRYMYLPSLGFCLLLGFYFERLIVFFNKDKFNYRRLIYAAGVLLAAVLGQLTWRQSKMWADEEAMWKQVIHYSPTSTAYQKIADYYFMNDLNDRALPFYLESVRWDPGNYESLTNLAVIAASRQNYYEALQFLDQALTANRKFSPAFVNRAVIYGMIGLYDKSIADFTTAVALDRNSQIAYLNRGILHLEMKNFDAAIDDFNRALKLNPFAGNVYYNRGVAYSQARKFREARQDFIYTLQLERGHPQARHNLDVINKMSASQPGPDL